MSTALTAKLPALRTSVPSAVRTTASPSFSRISARPSGRNATSIGPGRLATQLAVTKLSAGSPGGQHHLGSGRWC